MKKKTNIFVVLVVLLALGAGYGLAYYYYNQYQKVVHNPNAVAQDEVTDLTNKVGSLMELPKTETPVVATVLDKTKLQDQEFFKNAQNGDKLLVYSKAMKAILYRPESGKIVEVGPILLNNGTQQPSVNPTVHKSK